MNKRILEILANKAILLNDFPEWMLPSSTINKIRKTQNTAIAEIAGRDSIAAVIKACETNVFKAIIPTIAYTGTEFGDWEIPFKKTRFLKNLLKKKGVFLYDPILIGFPEFWWKLCGRYSVDLSLKYGFYSHCVGCHLYFHAIRIPLAKKLQCKIVIGGERESHDGRLKVNQIGIALDAYIAFMKKFGIELLLPLRFTKSGEEIELLIGKHWDEGKEQLACVLNKNYLDTEGRALINEDAVKKFLNEFAVKTAEESIKEYIENTLKKTNAI
jgi:hypothetical protein